jgi:glucose-6-phosphate 1-dehydrogenase
VTQRAAFYDATGATLGMLVTHPFQVAAEVAMEPPARPGACGPPRRPRVGALGVPTWTRTRTFVLGQFEGYRDIDGVADDSTTDTFVAARL